MGLSFGVKNHFRAVPKRGDLMPSVPQAADILASLGQASFVWEIGSDRLTWSENAASVFADIAASKLDAGSWDLHLAFHRSGTAAQVDAASDFRSTRGTGKLPRR